MEILTCNPCWFIVYRQSPITSCPKTTLNKKAQSKPRSESAICQNRTPEPTFLGTWGGRQTVVQLRFAARLKNLRPILIRSQWLRPKDRPSCGPWSVKWSPGEAIWTQTWAQWRVPLEASRQPRIPPVQDTSLCQNCTHLPNLWTKSSLKTNWKKLNVKTL